MANFLSSAGTICSSKLSNRPDGLICAPTSSNTAKFSIPTELNIICYGGASNCKGIS